MVSFYTFHASFFYDFILEITSNAMQPPQYRYRITAEVGWRQRNTGFLRLHCMETCVQHGIDTGLK
jgi:hypothetical protein